MGTIGDFGTLTMKWDPKNLEIRTMSVEKTLEPLVLQVTTLVNTKGPSKKKKGKTIGSLHSGCANISESVIHYLPVALEIFID